MVKKVYPIKWNEKEGKWILTYVTTAGNEQNVLSDAKIALQNYLQEFLAFQRTLVERSH